ncbi:uncharacterized protein LOC125652709 isoform X3 [Ostrea edulis]|uniref:uncharacterized protein LOC125652709 isoform X3 n=1 Tax=Ostrea edulis TaxID=37623 RepID=UPI002094ED7B|nr:uncharacterized protein LOC125652709 isoform X3 [Ostrea edulis]
MPSTIVPISLTRSHSLKGAPEGLRYGNFEGIVYLPPLKSDSSVGVQSYSKFNNQQIYKTICDWFESWRPWQQKTLLYGIVDRCSTRQLDILATTLEPVKHRDYAAAYKLRYPLSPFMNSKTRSDIRESRTPSKIGSRQSQKSDNNSVYTIASMYDERALLGPPQTQASAVQSLKYDQEDLLSDSAVSSVPSTTNKEVNKGSMVTDKLGVIQERVIFSERTELSPVHNFADNLASTIMQSALGEVAILQKFVNRENTTFSEENKPVSRKSSLQRSQSVQLRRKSDLSLIPPPGREFRIISPAVRSMVKTDLPKRGTELTRSLSNISHKSVSHLRYEFYGAPTTISTPDFFSRRGLAREGSMQKEIRYGQVKKPRYLQDVPISLQRSFKGVKWWTEQPHEGMVFLKAKKRDLIAHFKEQLLKIWNWLDMWEDYEKITLLKEILKISGSEVLNAMNHHIHQRLRGTRDINRLSDKILLYIFSLLMPKDVNISAQVCRRWRFLCATDSLWMIKCHELGLEEGITNMEKIVLRANTRKMGIDWKLAYNELRRLTNMMKMEARRRELAAIEEAERLRLLKAEQEASKRKIVYRKPSLAIDIEVKRGTQAVLEKEEAEKKEKEEARKRERYAIKFKRVKEASKVKNDEEEKSDDGDDVSDEDLSQFGDFVYQACEDEEDDTDEREQTRSQPHWKPLKKSGAEDNPKELEKIEADHQVDQRQREKEEKKRYLTKKQKTDVRELRSMVKQKPQPRKPKDEIALDVRTDLIQAEDLLGKSAPSLHLEWKKEDQQQEDSEYKLAVQRYMGVVKSVRRVRKLQGHMNGVVCVHFDKKRLISAGLDRCIRLWDIRSGQSIHKFYGHKGGVRCLQFEGNTLISGSWDTTVIVWDLKTFEKRAILGDHRGCVSCVQMHHKYIVSGSHDKTVMLWHRLTFMHCKTIEPGHKSGIHCLHYDGECVVTGSSDMTLRLTNVETEQCLHVFENGQNQVLSVLIQGDLLISSDTHGHVYFWNTRTGESEAAIQAHDGAVNKLAFHRGRFFTASSDCTMREWDLLTMTSVRVLQGHKGPIRDVKVSNERIVTCSDDGTIRIWDLIENKRSPRHN